MNAGPRTFESTTTMPMPQRRHVEWANKKTHTHQTSQTATDRSTILTYVHSLIYTPHRFNSPASKVVALEVSQPDTSPLKEEAYRNAGPRTFESTRIMPMPQRRHVEWANKKTHTHQTSQTATERSTILAYVTFLNIHPTSIQLTIRKGRHAG